ncbi:MAG: siderophore biosynthesis protein [Actinomycetota bacterium]|nr:siderophore biosynthesis protein [Actinomycetota bacterium]
MAVTVDERPPTTGRGADARPAPDPVTAADAFATATLLRCWLREGGAGRRDGDTLVVDLPASGTGLRVPVEHWSACGWHQFGPARLRTGTPADSTTVATLLALETARSSGAGPDAVGDLVERVADSTRRVARHLAVRSTEPEAPSGTPFLDAEQALVLGHPLHPTPKSRGGLTEAEADAYSPELRGRFGLFWFAADPGVVAGDSATGRPVEQVLRDLAGDLDLPAGMVPVPAHPWQAADVLRRPGVRTLVDDGRLRPLGQAGPVWSPTSSVRTVYRDGSPYMLKLSLALPITNSKRENLRKELLRGVEMTRMLQAGLAERIAAAHPRFGIVRDPAWVTVDAPGMSESGLEVVVRANPFGAGDRVQCLAGLVAERPDRDGRSLLAHLVHGLAEQTGRPVAEVGREWFSRYLDAVPAAVLWLYAEHGIGLEAHQQNTLVEIDEHGWPVGGCYRDNQGFYFNESRTADLDVWASRAGVDSDALNPQALIDERLGYYLGINNMLGLVGAMGSQDLADDGVLLREVRGLLEHVASRHDPVPGVVRALLEDSTLPCKANLLTRLAGMDELVGPVATQSVYRPVPNPVAEVAS